MLEALAHLCSGYVKFRVSGDTARFFNIAAKSGFGLWGFGKEGKTAVACVKVREYRKLRAVRRRCGVKMRVLERHGIPFYSVRLFRRKGMVLGLALGIGLFAFLSGFVWDVSVSGTQRLTDKEILDAAREYGVYEGGRMDAFRPPHTAKEIITTVKGISWATVNTDGCSVEIVIKESEQQKEGVDESGLSNIVAKREGKILGIQAERGKQEVELGQAVEQGQLLISGMYREEQDPESWTEVPPFVITGAARGTVIAETYREFTVQVSENKRELIPSGKKQVNTSLTLFGLNIPLGFQSAPEGEFRFYTHDSAVNALDVELPISMHSDIYEFLEPQQRTLTEEEMKESALLKLREAQKTALGEGGKIISEELEYTVIDGMCLLSAKCRCEEEIGQLQKVG